MPSSLVKAFVVQLLLFKFKLSTLLLSVVVTPETVELLKVSWIFSVMLSVSLNLTFSPLASILPFIVELLKVAEKWLLIFSVNLDTTPRIEP